MDFCSVCVFLCHRFYLLARALVLGVKPSPSESAAPPAPDDELDPPVKKFPLDEVLEEPRSVDAPEELADCANAFCIACGPIIPNSPDSTVPATKNIAIVDVFMVFLHRDYTIKEFSFLPFSRDLSQKG